LIPKYQRTWFVVRNVAGHKYGNGISDTAYPTTLGNSEMGHLKKVYRLF